MEKRQALKIAISDGTTPPSSWKSILFSKIKTATGWVLLLPEKFFLSYSGNWWTINKPEINLNKVNYLLTFQLEPLKLLNVECYPTQEEMNKIKGYSIPCRIDLRFYPLYFEYRTDSVLSNAQVGDSLVRIDHKYPNSITYEYFKPGTFDTPLADDNVNFTYNKTIRRMFAFRIGRFSVLDPGTFDINFPPEASIAELSLETIDDLGHRFVPTVVGLIPGWTMVDVTDKDLVISTRTVTTELDGIITLSHTLTNSIPSPCVVNLKIKVSKYNGNLLRDGYFPAYLQGLNIDVFGSHNSRSTILGAIEVTYMMNGSPVVCSVGELSYKFGDHIKHLELPAEGIYYDYDNRSGICYSFEQNSAIIDIVQIDIHACWDFVGDSKRNMYIRLDNNYTNSPNNVPINTSGMAGFRKYNPDRLPNPYNGQVIVTYPVTETWANKQIRKIATIKVANHRVMSIERVR